MGNKRDTRDRSRNDQTSERDVNRNWLGCQNRWASKPIMAACLK